MEKGSKISKTKIKLVNEILTGLICFELKMALFKIQILNLKHIKMGTNAFLKTLNGTIFTQYTQVIYNFQKNKNEMQ